MRQLSAMANWLGSTLTRKFILLLVGFLVLQILQLVISVYGIPRIGEERAYIDQTGRMRMQTVLISHLLHTSMGTGAWNPEDRRAFEAAIAEGDIYFRELPTRTGLVRGDSEYAALMKEMQRYWQEVMRPRLSGLDPGQHRNTRERYLRYEAAIPAQMERFDRMVRVLEEGLRKDSHFLAVLQQLVLGASILLGVIGIWLARFTVSRPLRELIVATREIAAGGYHRRLKISSRDEIGVVAATFNDMASAIEQNNRRLLVFNPITTAMASSLSVDEIVHQILPHGLDLSDSQAACLVFYDGERGQPADFHTRGLPAPVLKHLQAQPDPLAMAVHEHSEGAVVSDGLGGLRSLAPVEREAGFRSVACLPLVNQSQRLGVLYFYRATDNPFSGQDLELLAAFARLAAQAIYNARLHARIENMAVRDSLSGLYNRRWFDEHLQDQIRRSRRFGKPLTLLLLDIDHFKRINDHYGHPAGDAVLRRVAEVIGNQLREVDAVARVGGEEIAILLPETDDIEGKHGAERIRRAVASTSFRLPGGEEIGVAVSLGVASFPLCAGNAEELTARADQALYVAKQSGRNAVVLYRDILTTRIEKEPGYIAKLLNEGLQVIPTLVTAVAAKAAFYRGHTRIVEQTAMRLAKLLHLTAEECESLRLASQLHDIGMAVVPDVVLNKTTPLTPEEWNLIRQHPAVAAQILEQVPALRTVMPIVRHHHERWDGEGYPDRLKGNEIPYLARVLAVADTYGSVISDWPGHKAFSVAEAAQTLRAASGLQTDPEITEILLKHLSGEPGGN